MPQRRTLQNELGENEAYKIPLVSDGNMENSRPHEKQWAEPIWALKLKSWACFRYINELSRRIEFYFGKIP